MNARIAGLLLFLPVPLVLTLFTRLPLGVPVSIALGVVIMATHRFYARPFALRHAAGRCLWCGRVTHDGPAFEIKEPFGRTTWRACEDVHAARVRQVLAWATRHARLLKAGILGGLVVFLVGVLAAHYGALGSLRPPDAVAFFRLSVALSVLPLGLLAARTPAPDADPAPAPFPVHIQALIGTWAVLWLFRIVGAVWLVLAVLHVAL
jgi:hypothetical protein